MISYDAGTHTYTNAEGKVLPSVSRLLEKHGFIKGGAYIDPIYAERGTMVHSITEMIDAGVFAVGDSGFFQEYFDEEGKLPFRPFIAAYEKFLTKESPNWIDSELIVSYEDIYAGKLDRVGIIGSDGETGIWDIKTSSRPAKWHPIQTAAYAMAFDPNNWEDIPRGCIYLKKDGNYKVERHSGGVGQWKTIVALEQAYGNG